MRVLIPIAALILVALVEADLHHPAVPYLATILIGLFLYFCWTVFNDVDDDDDHDH